jgi:hypothetical protein
MALTSLDLDNELVTYNKKLVLEYQRVDPFKKLKNTYGTSVFHLEKSNGGEINIPYMANLNGQGVGSVSKLSGNEESLKDSNFRLRSYVSRNGVKISRKTIKDASFLYKSAQVTQLKKWHKQRDMDMAIRALLGIQVSGVKYNYGGNYDPSHDDTNGAPIAKATNAQLDTWCASNSDRILYGATTANYSAGNFTASLANIDTTNDKLSKAIFDLAKQLCYEASPPIAPLASGEDLNETYLALVCTVGFNQIRKDMGDDLRHAEERGKMNPIFSGADLYYNGIYIKHVPMIDYMIDGSTSVSSMYGSWGSQSNESLVTAGNSSTRVAPAFLLGQQAIAEVIEDPVEMIQDTDNTDYKEFQGMAIRSSFDYRPISFKDDKRHGIFTIFHSAAKAS